MNQNDQSLIIKLKKGDKVAINQLYQRHKSYWFRICLRYGRNRDEAQDLFQDGVAKVFQEIKKFDEERRTFKAWSNKVLIHEILKSLKKNQWQESFEGLDSSDINFDWNGEIVEKITAKELTEMIQNLPFGFRVVFNMYEIEGYSHREIAEELNISVGTSKSQLSRAKKTLQHKIQMLF